MYDRYAIYSSTEEIKETLTAEVPEGYSPSYNAAPTHLLPVITSEGRMGISFFHWGLMTKWSNSKTSISAKSINLDSELAFQRPGYKKQIQSHRCIVPINGFYAWKRVSKKQLVPYYFFSPQMPILGIAGLWEEFEDIDGTVSHSFIVLLVSSSSSLIEFENKMPAILDSNKSRIWLDSKDLEENEKLIASVRNDHPVLSSHSVSPSIKNIENNYPDLIKPVPASDQLGNYTLFN
ncbi:MAG: SOS response-associated peptidase [Cytophagales bacterium]|nr:SOS response-associated peptidase [Cytophagales bacterium]